MSSDKQSLLPLNFINSTLSEDCYITTRTIDDSGLQKKEKFLQSELILTIPWVI